jgi:hypothetical protein
MQIVTTFSAAATICSQSPGKIHHISSFLILRHLVQPHVATCGSCFLTCQVISSKNHIKDEFQTKCLRQLRKKTKSFRIRYFFNFFVLNNLLSNFTSNYCEHHMATPRGIRVKSSKSDKMFLFSLTVLG